jgi:hypothetical protein
MCPQTSLNPRRQFDNRFATPTKNHRTIKGERKISRRVLNNMKVVLMLAEEVRCIGSTFGSGVAHRLFLGSVEFFTSYLGILNFTCNKPQRSPLILQECDLVTFVTATIESFRGVVWKRVGKESSVESTKEVYFFETLQAIKICIQNVK